MLCAMDKSQKDIGLKVIPFTAQFAWINSGAENEKSGISMEQREENQKNIELQNTRNKNEENTKQFESTLLNGQ